jgi:hypothetical protein
MLRLSDDRGTIAVVTAVLGSAVLFACAAIAIDVGALYTERRQLQSGADAAAIAIAQSCARGPCDILSAKSLAAELAGGNAVDGAADVPVVCGTALDVACLPSPESRASCDPVPTDPPPYVEVHTRTRNPDGSGVVAPFFARAIPGNEDYAGTTVGACARAAYGSPKSAFSILPVTVSQCVVDDYVAAHDGGFAPWSLSESSPSTLGEWDPELGPWDAEIELHQDTGPCSTSSSGSNAPGNFGFLASNDECSATTTLDAWQPGSTGNANPKTLGCTDSYLASLLGKVAYIPVFDTVTSGGNYHVVGYAAFLFTGWQLSGTSHDSIATGELPCKKPTTCVSGVFLRGLQPTPGPIGPAAPDYGATVVQLID